MATPLHPLSRVLLVTLALGLGLACDPKKESGDESSTPAAKPANSTAPSTPQASDDSGSREVPTGGKPWAVDPRALPPGETQATKGPGESSGGARGEATGSIARNGGFSEGKGDWADHWKTAGSQPPRLAADGGRSGSGCMRARLENEGAKPSEGLLIQRVFGKVAGGRSYDLSFWVKELDYGESYLQEYQITWLDDRDRVVGETGLTAFRGGADEWRKIEVPDLIAPPQATGVELRFRFVTGALEGGAGHVLLDDVSFAPAF